ncbi:MAG: nucleotidyltransferase domain-containing protein [Gemmatimonadota bacterium]
MGILFHPLDAILSSRSKVRLLRVLLPLDEAVSAREAARLAGTPLAPSLRALSDLASLGALRVTRLRGQHLYTVNRENPLVRDGLAPLFELEAARVSDVYARLRESLGAEMAAGSVLTLAVYGSAARGEDRPGSDLDVLVVTRDAGDAVRVHDALSRAAPAFDREFGLDLAPMVLSRAQLDLQAEAQDPVIMAMREEARLVAGLPLDHLSPTLRS